MFIFRLRWTKYAKVRILISDNQRGKCSNLKRSESFLSEGKLVNFKIFGTISYTSIRRMFLLILRCVQSLLTPIDNLSIQTVLCSTSWRLTPTLSEEEILSSYTLYIFIIHCCGHIYCTHFLFYALCFGRNYFCSECWGWQCSCISRFFIYIGNLLFSLI